jgi:2-oxoglutarate ferredoxin oxidoreductase subunit beta
MENKVEVKTAKLTAKDFASDQDVRWCPGCGDYSILAQVQRTFPEIIDVPKEDVVWISGIGCSSRFPYYMDTYGFHGIHGRAPILATGVKLANPKLSVWVATGDGDLLSIGGNHFIHACKTTPFGSVDYPFNPTMLATGSEATFVARSIDRHTKHLQEMIKRVGKHQGTAFLEIYQNCNIFNDGAFSLLTEKDTKDDNVLILEQGKPMVFGKDGSKGIKLDGFTPRVVDLTTGQFSKDDLWIHEEFEESYVRSAILSSFTETPGFPTPIGVFRQVFKPTYDQALVAQIEDVKKKKGEGDLTKVLFGGNTWEVN